MPHVNDSLRVMNDALAVLQSKIDAVLTTCTGMDPAALQAMIQSAVDAAIAEIMARLQEMDISVITIKQLLMRRVLGMINAYGPDKYLFEYFGAYFTIADQYIQAGVSTVAGDDSIDIPSTTGLVAGGEYVIAGGGSTYTVQILDVLSATRFRLTAPMSVSLTGATLRRTNWHFGETGAVAGRGQAYYSSPVSLGDDSDNALVIRRVDSDAVLRVYCRAVGYAAWSELAWAWRRDHTSLLPDYGPLTAGPEAGESDYEYAIPLRVPFELKIVCEVPDGVDQATTVDVRHVIGLNHTTGLGGIHRPPDAPANVSPVDGATNIGATPTLQCDGYHHSAGTAQAGFEVEVAASATFGNVLYSSRLGSVSGHAIPAGMLAASKTYYWRARYVDILGGVSDWSTPTHFATAAALPTYAVATPVNATPANNAERISGTPTLSASAFAATGGAATHLAAQWQVAQDAAFATILYDSGTDATHLTSLTVPTALSAGPRYFRVRYQGRFTGPTDVWSAWSVPTKFTVQDSGAFVGVLGGAADVVRLQTVAMAADGIVVAGERHWAADGKAIVVKLDSAGDVTWQTALGGVFLFGNAVAMGTDGSIVVAGHDATGDSVTSDALIFKMSGAGVLQWQRLLHNAAAYVHKFNAVVMGTDGSIYAAGEETYGLNTVPSGAVLAKFASDGVLLWQKTLSGSGENQFKGLAIAPDGSLYACGQTNYAPWLVKFSANGEVVWSTILQTQGIFQAAAVSPDGSRLYTAGIKSGSPMRGLAAKYTVDGQIAWQKSVSGGVDTALYGCAAGLDGRLYLAGHCSYSAGYAPLLVAMTSDGALTWKRALVGSDGYHELYGVTVSAAGDVCAAGDETSISPGGGLLVRLPADAASCVGTLPNLPQFSWDDLALTVEPTSASLATPTGLSTQAGASTASDPNYAQSDPALEYATSNY